MGSEMCIRDRSGDSRTPCFLSDLCFHSGDLAEEAIANRFGISLVQAAVRPLFQHLQRESQIFKDFVERTVADHSCEPGNVYRVFTLKLTGRLSRRNQNVCKSLKRGTLNLRAIIHD